LDIKAAMPVLDGKLYLSTQQVANSLQVSKATIKNWLKSRTIEEPPRHPANGYRLWTLTDVESIRVQMREKLESK
jgi:DNA-binding transcriptional MerR regulator